MIEYVRWDPLKSVWVEQEEKKMGPNLKVFVQDGQLSKQIECQLKDGSTLRINFVPSSTVSQPDSLNSHTFFKYIDQGIVIDRLNMLQEILRHINEKHDDALVLTLPEGSNYADILCFRLLQHLEVICAEDLDSIESDKDLENQIRSNVDNKIHRNSSIAPAYMPPLNEIIPRVKSYWAEQSSAALLWYGLCGVAIFFAISALSIQYLPAFVFFAIASERLIVAPALKSVCAGYDSSKNSLYGVACELHISEDPSAVLAHHFQQNESVVPDQINMDFGL